MKLNLKMVVQMATKANGGKLFLNQKIMALSNHISKHKVAILIENQMHQALHGLIIIHKPIMMTSRIENIRRENMRMIDSYLVGVKIKV